MRNVSEICRMWGIECLDITLPLPTLLYARLVVKGLVDFACISEYYTLTYLNILFTVGDE